MKRIFLSLLSLCAISLYAQSDSLSTRSIDELVVEEVRQPLVRYNMLGKTYWSIETMKAMPMSDPLRNIQLLPGVHANSENTGGVFVQGCDNSHNYTTINGTPVYYPMHLLGFFSTFNSSYFKDLTFNKSMRLVTANRLGAEVGMETADTIPDKLGVDVDLGMMTAQGMVSMPLGSKLSLSVAGRYSDVNAIYDGMMNMLLENQRIAYRFYDINMGVLYKPTERDDVSIEYFEGSDYANLDIFTYMINSRLHWGNRNASLRWSHQGDRLMLNHAVYYTAYRSVFDMLQTDSRICLPASIQTLGAKSEQRYMADYCLLTYGGEVMRHVIAPQAPQITGSYATTNMPRQVQEATEGAVYMQADIMLNHAVELVGGLRLSGFYNTRWQMVGDPRLTLRYHPSSLTTWQLTAGSYTQYLHQVGFSSNGLPTEFWISSDNGVAPQYARKVSLALQQELVDRRYRISVETYFARLCNQVEYKGNALGLITEEYDLNENLVVGNGYNYGVDLMLQKNVGHLTGWVSYSWARAPRSFVQNHERVAYPSVHNREHDLNVVLNWKLDDRWNLSATYIYATGTPYTEVKHAYILGENAIVSYEKHNSSRYPALTRLDLALNYQLPRVGEMSHSVKLAVYNATFAKNPISYNYNNFRGNIVYKRPVCLFSTAVPSVSYLVQF